MNQRWSWPALAVALLAALYFVAAVWSPTPGVPAYDIYAYYYPNMLYALERLHEGGSGLLWNPFQNCGQPLFGISSTGLLYPASLFFLLLSADHALGAVIAFNLTVAGVSAYLLARELGVGRLGALGGALAFELGNASIDMNTWSPMVGGAYVWLPAMMWSCERLLRAPSLRGGLALAAIIGLALLPGFPQAVFFGYQLIGLRVLWALALRQISQPRATLAALAIGLGLAPLLIALQLVPGIEMARLSVRNAPLTLKEIMATSAGIVDWEGLRDTIGRRREILNPLLVVPCMVASWSLVVPTTRRRALFYCAAGLLFFTLAFGPDGPLFDWYLRLPFGRAFRGPGRFLWVTGFCLAVMTALGIEALRSSGARAVSRARGLVFALAAGLALIGFRSLSPAGLWPLEWVLGGVTILAGLCAAGAAPAPLWGASAATAALVLNLASFPLAAAPDAIAAMAVRASPFRRLLASGELLFAHGELFARLRARITPQDRAYLVFPHGSFSLAAKSAQLFGVPAIQDYEPQPTRRSAEYGVMMRTGAPLRSVSDYYLLPEGSAMTTALRRRLFDLTAARYLVVEATADETNSMRPPLERLFDSSDGTVHVYENARALPRARYVPRVEVESDPQALLRRLRDAPRHDLRQVVLVEAVPPTGFTGVPGNDGDGSVEFLVDDPEHVVLRVNAPERGFLHLADQYYPGWAATVNGAPSPILAANFLFRLVEVPAGESVVEFRYAPTSLRLGAAVTALAIAAVVLLLRQSRRHGRAASRAV